MHHGSRKTGLDLVKRKLVDEWDKQVFTKFFFLSTGGLVGKEGRFCILESSSWIYTPH